jgi:type IV pilus assembly protein PilB
MATTLNPKSLGGGDKIDLSTISGSRMHRSNRVIQDLDKQFIERDTRSRARLLGIPYIDLYGFPIDTAHLEVIPQNVVIKVEMGPFTINSKEIYLASPNPNAPGQSEVIAQLQQRGYTTKLFLCSHDSFRKLVDMYNHIMDTEIADDVISLSEQDLLDQKSAENLAKLEESLKGKSVSEKIEAILSAALSNNASDIHFEPEKEEYVLRLRLDGVLHTFAELPQTERKSIESRIKLLSGLKINIDNIPQDGRFTFKANGKDIDVRVSMLPSNYGYSIVMRLLGTGNLALELDTLGFVGVAKDRVQQAIAKPQGMILTTGPTGSGKTTTLYTFLSDLNGGDTKIITLEDPIEYKLEGVSQTQIDHKAGYTFGSGLRSILRQDPDVVMVGEIRDPETAETAVQAAMTGHLVLSTLHTNDAAGAIPRLMDMNIRGFLLADALSVLIAQRLMRRLCPHCKRPDNPSPEKLQEMKDLLATIPEGEKTRIPENFQFYTADGCEHCNGLGYKGRVGAYEVITMTSGLRELISSQFPSIVQVREIAQKEGMITMKQDAVLKALAGTTDIKEIERTIV